MKYSMTLLAILLSGMLSVVHANTAGIQGNVVSTLVADQDRWGGCMARLSKPIASVGVDCPGEWVSFSCSGIYTRKEIAYRMFDMAQLALTKNHQIAVYVDDTQKHNGYCYANRVDLVK
jgi:hypothetical protein